MAGNISGNGSEMVSQLFRNRNRTLKKSQLRLVSLRTRRHPRALDSRGTHLHTRLS